MSKLLWIACFGLCFWLSVSQTSYEISCRFRGVFHVQKDVRYNQTAEEARRTCLELGAIIASKEMVQLALDTGFEICRYGWVDNNTVVIPRITANPICAANYVGLFVLHTNLTARYDVFCYNTSDESEKNCEQYNYRNTSVPSHDPTEEETTGVDSDSGSNTVSPTHPGLNLNSTSLEPGMILEDVTADPEMSTEQEHSGDHTTSTEDGAIITPDLYDGDNGQNSSTDADDLILVATADETHIHQEDGKAPATDPTSNWNSGPGYGVDNDSGSNTVSPPHPGLNLSSTSLEPGVLLEDVMVDPKVSTEKEHSGDHTTPTEDGGMINPDLYDGDNGQNSSTDPDDLILVATADETHIHQEDSNAPATDPTSNWNSGPGYEEVQPDEPQPSDDQDDSTVSISTYPDGSKGSTHTKQKRKAVVPDWLIVCVSLVCLALIFSVCIALNARKICGQKKKLIINGNKGHPEDGVIMEQNGDTVKSQEMVQLVSKDETSDFDQKEPLNQEEIRHEKDADVKIKV
ncbi:CD44 antigen [Gastrophryne carolinensis]